MVGWGGPLSSPPVRCLSFRSTNFEVAGGVGIALAPDVAVASGRSVAERLAVEVRRSGVATASTTRKTLPISPKGQRAAIGVARRYVVDRVVHACRAGEGICEFYSGSTAKTGHRVCSRLAAAQAGSWRGR